MSASELKPCPFCGEPAHRIAPMGFWEPGGYSPRGVRFVCSGLYQVPPKICPGDGVEYPGSDPDAEARAIEAWNTRATDPALTAAQAEIARLTAELEDWKAAATRHHPNPADYRYWEGRYRDEKARAEKAEAERDAGIALLAAWRAPDVEDLIAALKYMLQWFPVSEEDDFDEGPDPVDVAKRALAAFEV